MDMLSQSKFIPALDDCRVGNLGTACDWRHRSRILEEYRGLKALRTSYSINGEIAELQGGKAASGLLLAMIPKRTG